MCCLAQDMQMLAESYRDLNNMNNAADEGAAGALLHRLGKRGAQAVSVNQDLEALARVLASDSHALNLARNERSTQSLYRLGKRAFLQWRPYSEYNYHGNWNEVPVDYY